MKYEEKKVRGVGRERRRALEQIAMEAGVTLQERGGIEERGNDSEDFLEVSILGIQRMLEEAYRLGREDGQRSVELSACFIRPDSSIISGNSPTDRNDPDSEWEAVELSVPECFSRKAKAVMEYLDGAGSIFAYKDRLVLTDESLELDYAGDGTKESPFGGPRMACGSWEELEDELEAGYSELRADGLI